MFKALLIDDEVAILGMLTHLLEREGFEVVTARSAATGAELVERESFDIVVTDLRMESPLAGYEVVRAARQLNPPPVIVILTAFPVPASDWKAAGADALLVKGVRSAIALPAQLKALLTKQGRQVA